jgi:hypothetical protein
MSCGRDWIGTPESRRRRALNIYDLNLDTQQPWLTPANLSVVVPMSKLYCCVTTKFAPVISCASV